MYIRIFQLSKHDKYPTISKYTKLLESFAGINGGNLTEQGGEPRDDP